MNTAIVVHLVVMDALLHHQGVVHHPNADVEVRRVVEHRQNASDKAPFNVQLEAIGFHWVPVVIREVAHRAVVEADLNFLY